MLTSLVHLSAYPLPISPVNVKFTSDHILSSAYVDSASLTPDLGSVSSNSSTVSQPQPDLTSSTRQVSERNGISQTMSRPDLNSTPSSCSGYKFVIDNIDMGVKPKYQRVDSQNQSLYYIQVYAVKDQVDFGQLSSTPPPPGRSVYELPPSTMDTRC